LFIWVLFYIPKMWKNRFFCRNPHDLRFVIWRSGEVFKYRALWHSYKGLGRVQFPSNFPFLAKIRRKIRVSSENLNFKDLNSVFWISLSILHQLAGKTFEISVLYLKYLTNLNVPKKTRLRSSARKKIRFKPLYVHETCFGVKFKYCCFV
jgi:hypothetical protein